MVRLLALTVAALGLGVYAAPAPITEELERRQSIATLSAASISAFTPYSYYASTGYCTPATTLAWNCGGSSSQDRVRESTNRILVANCNANPGFKTVASGGDGTITQYCKSYPVVKTRNRS